MNVRPIGVIAAAVLLVLSSCSSEGESEASTADDPSTTEATEEAVDVEYESPLGEFLGWSVGADFDADAEQERFAAMEREVQEAVAACMAEQGFEYVPIDTSAQNAFFEEQFNDGLEWGSEEWTQKYGFGVSTQRFSQDQVGPDLVGNNYDQGVSDEGGFTDPNQDYVASLGENEQNAYYAALYGDEQGYEWDESLSEEENEAAMNDFFENEYVPSGCEPVAYEEIYEDGGQEQWGAFDEAFGGALEEMEERFESHPDVVAYRADVQACVEERGLEYLTENDAYEHFEGVLNDAGLGWESEVDPFEGIDTSDFTDEDFERVWQESQRQLLSPDKLEALAEVQETEIATAMAIRECGGGWQAEQAELASVRIEMEEEFLAANADRLAEFEGVFGN